MLNPTAEAGDLPAFNSQGENISSKISLLGHFQLKGGPEWTGAPQGAPHSIIMEQGPFSEKVNLKRCGRALKPSEP